MLIKYINEITYCCGRMKVWMDNSNVFYDKKGLYESRITGNVYISYCPFCGEKVEVTNK
jgi:hypothetical protein